MFCFTSEDIKARDRKRLRKLMQGGREAGQTCAPDPKFGDSGWCALNGCP